MILLCSQGCKKALGEAHGTQNGEEKYIQSLGGEN
jgi:hypothetical protein